VDKTGTLCWDEFQQYLKEEKIQAYFQSLDFDVSQARTLFKLLDRDNSDSVDINEFVLGCMKMKGHSRSVDVNMLMYETQRMMGRQSQFFDYRRRCSRRCARGTASARATRRTTRGAAPSSSAAPGGCPSAPTPSRGE